MIRFLIFALIIAAGAAYLTKPSPDAVRGKARDLVVDAIERGNIDDVGDPALAVLLASCQSDPNGCAGILMQGIELTYEDRTLYARIDARGFGRSATCYGAFTRLLCPNGLVR